MSLKWKTRWALAAASLVLCVGIAAISWGAFGWIDTAPSDTSNYNLTIGNPTSEIQVYAPDEDIVFSVHAWDGSAYRHFLPDTTRNALGDSVYTVYAGVPFGLEINYPSSLSGTTYSDITLCIERTSATAVTVLAK